MKNANKFFLCFVLALVSFNARTQVVRVDPSLRANSSIPEYFESWTYTDVYDTNNGGNYYGNSNRDVCYAFILVQPAIVVISHFGSVLENTSLCLSGNKFYSDYTQEYKAENSSLSEEQQSLLNQMQGHTETDLPENISQIGSNQALLCVSLQAGNYSVYCEGSDIGSPNNGQIKTSFYVYYLGSTMAEAIELVGYGDDYKESIVHHAKGTQASPSHLYFKLNVQVRSELSVNGLGKRGQYGRFSVLDENCNEKFSSDSYPTIGDYPQIESCWLNPGTYYICSSGNAGLGEVFVNIKCSPLRKKGDWFDRPLVQPSYGSSGTWSLEYDTNSYSNCYGKKTNDVFVGLRLLKDFHIEVSNNGTSIPTGFTMALVDSEYKLVSSAENFSKVKKKLTADVPAGFYYLILEGRANNGIIKVNLSLQKLDTPLIENHFTPSTSSNYIVSAVAMANVVEGAENISTGNMLYSVEYYDGLGRPVQTVSQRGSSARSILTGSLEYDDFGRESRVWSAVPGHPDGTRMPLEELFSASHTFYNDNAAFTNLIYEESPLERVKSQFNPGETWRKLNASSDVSYTTDIIEKYVVIGDRDNYQLSAQGNYALGELNVTETSDENGHVTKTYSDCYGRNICIDQEGLRTFYVYDLYGNLCFVLPPDFSGNVSESNLLIQAYIYRYNKRNLCIKKKIPGADWIEYRYDNSDYLVYTRDGSLRSQGKWLCSIHDTFGREVIQGIGSVAVESSVLENMNVCAEFDSSAPMGYYVPETVRIDEYLNVNYYDNYSFLFLGNAPEQLAYTEDLEYGLRYGTNLDDYKHKGLLTGSYGKMLGLDSEMTWTAYYYDVNQRPIQTVQLLPSGGEQIVKNRYTFNGVLLYSEQSLRPDANSEYDVVFTKNEYTPEGKLSRVETSVGDNIASAISYEYDDIGRLKSVTQESVRDSLRTEMCYNVRNWLTSSRNDKFESYLSYADSLVHGTAPDYSGNIAEWRWKNGEEYTYGFTYDSHSRLTDAALYNTNGVQNLFAERNISYDCKGNIVHLDRISAGTVANRLNYNYSNHHLIAVMDSTSMRHWNYAYDTNGRMYYDGHYDRYMTYNIAGLVEQYGPPEGPALSYAYLPDGTKFSAIDNNGNGLYYIGPAVYRKSAGSMTLESIAIPGGRLVNVGDGLKPLFYLTDHLGSTRVIVDGENGEVLRRYNYYPFGSQWAEAASEPSDSLYHNRYLFNGKESQSFADFNYLDYGARMYDPQWRLSWNTPDPLAEKYYSVSPYAFCAGNPVNFVDNDGRFPFVLPVLPYIAAAIGATAVTTATYVAYKHLSSTDLSGWKNQQRKDRKAKEDFDRAQLNVQNSIEQNYPDPDNFDPNNGPEFRGGSDSKRTFLLFLCLLGDENSPVRQFMINLISKAKDTSNQTYDSDTNKDLPEDDQDKVDNNIQTWKYLWNGNGIELLWP